MVRFREQHDQIVNGCRLEGHCFLCGVDFNNAESSEEHIIPQWLLRAYDLWNVLIPLNNGRSIPYRQLLIEACKPCNNVFLKRIEDQVCAEVIKTEGSLFNLDDTTIALWMAKVMIASHIKATRMDHDVKRDDGPSLLPEALRDNQLHLMLQSARGIVKLVDGPDGAIASVFRFKCAPTYEPKFEFLANFLHLSCAMKFEREAILIIFDGGAQSMIRNLHRYSDKTIENYPQLVELLSVVNYVDELMLSQPVYEYKEEEDHLLARRIGFVDRSEPEIVAFPDSPTIEKEFEDLKRRMMQEPKLGAWSHTRFNEILFKNLQKTLSAEQVSQGRRLSYFST